jgi:general secretion pathway protein F
MAAYVYHSMDKNGRTKKGVLEGDNPRQIRQQLREQSLIPLQVEQVADKERGAQQGFQLFKNGISAADLSLLTRQMSTLGA